MSLISCHSSHASSLRPSSHITHLMSRSHVTHHISRSHVTHHMSLISCLSTTSIISCLITMSVISYVSSLRHWYTFNFCPRPLPTNHHIIIPVISAQPLRINLCPPRSVLLPRRIGIGFQGVSNSSQSRSHVTHLMSNYYITQPGLKG